MGSAIGISAATLIATLGITREEVLVAGALVRTTDEPHTEARWSAAREAAGTCGAGAV
ncbi:hypothetical protein GCM10010151_72270 [Actinoallomurus spadix]|uniref:Uncharacterized protein n=1 Tax=Actinoallomurus spadix TaxID=79912 RepID=A0ABP3HJN1_9ACTN